MILVDTSVWVDHLRRGRADLAGRLERGEVVCHRFVIGELACGRLRNRSELLTLLGRLPRVESSQHEEVLAFLDANELAGSGLGWIDVHLLAAAALSGTPIWTLDRRLASASRACGLAASIWSARRAPATCAPPHGHATLPAGRPRSSGG